MVSKLVDDCIPASKVLANFQMLQKYNERCRERSGGIYHQSFSCFTVLALLDFALALSMSAASAPSNSFLFRELDAAGEPVWSGVFVPDRLEVRSSFKCAGVALSPRAVVLGLNAYDASASWPGEAPGVMAESPPELAGLRNS